MHGYFGSKVKPQRVCAVLAGLFVALSYSSIIAQQTVPRKVLALYKSSEGRTEEENEIANVMQLALNNLGLVVVYRDAEKPLPPIDSLADYRGIITYFINEDMLHARRYRQWFKMALKHPLKFVIFNNFGAYREKGRKTNAKTIREIRSLFSKLGVRIPFRYIPAMNVTIAFKDSTYFDFERPLDHVATLSEMRSIDQRNRVLLNLRDEENGIENDAVIVGKWGAIVQSGTAFWLDENTGHMQWYLNPFTFFTDVFHLDSLPIPEINVLGGKRLAFIHIDGDGFRTISKINRWDMCAKLMQERVFERYQLPFSVSVITADVSPELFGDAHTMKTARDIFSLPNVEAASHAYAHPFNWRTGWVAFDSIPGYHFDEKLEIEASMQFIQEELLPPGKINRLFFWTGMCNPTEAQIEQVESRQWLQINGVAGFLHEDAPSITSFAPPYSQVGSRVRINARISNEYELTNHWHNPYNYRHIISTLKFTENNGPLTPANIYLHYYIMEFEESWQALKDVLKWSLHQGWAFVYTSDYIRMVHDFLNLRLVRESGNVWLVVNSGALRTLRFRNEPRSVNLAASHNVLGYQHLGNDLLVHLNAAPRHRIVLSDTSENKINLFTFNMLVDSLATTNTGVNLWVKGYGEFEARLRHVKPGRYYRAVAEPLSSTDRADWPIQRAAYYRSDDFGQLTVRVPVHNASRVRISEVPIWVYWKHKLRIVVLIALTMLAFIWYQKRESKPVPLSGLDNRNGR
ncbi:MAG: hypothetical protein Q9P90_15260 [candidate division KSB1 bacterium]|nr:hypothetical protein [candidate division KSB1 bacterium]